MKRTTHTLGELHLKAVFLGGKVVVLYHQLYVIKTILQYTQKLASYMKETYAEEFRCKLYETARNKI
jgi:urease accessory protein UreE